MIQPIGKMIRPSVLHSLLPVTIGASLLAVLLEFESSCWSEGPSLNAAAVRTVWIVPLFAALHGLGLAAQRSSGRATSTARAAVTGAAVVLILGIGIRLWASSQSSAILSCALVAVRENPTDAVAQLKLGEAYEGLANEDYPPEWTAPFIPARARVNTFLNWQSEMRDNAIDAYAEAARLQPTDWKPLHNIAGVLFVEGDCDAGARFARAAASRLEIIKEPSARPPAEQQVRLLELSERLCRDLENRAAPRR